MVSANARFEMQSKRGIEAAPKVVAGKTEMDAMIAYLQVLGTMAKLDDAKAYRE